MKAGDLQAPSSMSPPDLGELRRGRAGADLVVFSDNHNPYPKRVGRTLFVNVGPVGKPHDGDRRACYAVLDLGGESRVELRRVDYDVAAAAKGAVRQAGLPEAFAEILERGGPSSPQG